MRFKIKKAGNELLSHPLMDSTIAAKELNDRVRDGNGCGQPPMGTGRV